MGSHHENLIEGAILNCTVKNAEHGKIGCSNVSTPFVFEESPLGPDDPLFWVYLCSYVGLVTFAGMMSGLTLTILSLDVTQLTVMIKASEKSLGAGNASRDAKYAKRILPLAKRQHIVLVALVIANSLAVEAMPLVLDKVANIYVAMATSVTAVLFIGEVLPQAICSRFGLAIGYHMAWMVWGLVGIFFIVAYPVSLLLDRLLGKDHGTFYRRAELAALVDMHGPSYQSGRGPLLNDDEVKIIRAALHMTSKNAVSLIRQSLSDTYMLPVEACFDEATLMAIMRAGHSRIPVFQNCDRNQVVQVLLVKKLILVDPKAKMPVREAIAKNVHGAFTAPYFVDENESVHNMLDYFQKGKTHIAFVRKKKPPGGKQELQGVVTLENIVEMLLEDEIWDETDHFRKSTVDKPEALLFGIPCSLPNARCSHVDGKMQGEKTVCKGPPGHKCKYHHTAPSPKPKSPDSMKSGTESKRLSYCHWFPGFPLVSFTYRFRGAAKGGPLIEQHVIIGSCVTVYSSGRRFGPPACLTHGIRGAS